MRSPHLHLALFLIIGIALQSHALKLSNNQNYLNPDSSSDRLFHRFGFKELLQVSSDKTSRVRTIANLFSYYLDGTLFFNRVVSLFAKADTEQKSLLTLSQYYDITNNEGVHEADAHRVLQYVRPHVTQDNGADPTSIDAMTFFRAAEVILAETLSMFTFTYIMGGPQHSRKNLISLETVEKNFVEIFSKLGKRYPSPDCEEIKYLFGQADKDEDNMLNIQEFHVLLSIYLRYFKYGLKNNQFASIMMQDKVFELAWINEEGPDSEKVTYLRSAFTRFFQICTSDTKQNQISHLFFFKSDTDHSDTINIKEFRALLAPFDGQKAQEDLLFNSADIKKNGELDFGEFTILIETLFRTLVSDFGYDLMRFSAQKPTVTAVYDTIKSAAVSLGQGVLSFNKFQEVFDSVDTDRDGLLTKAEFSVLVSEIITYYRAKMRLSEEAQIASIAGLSVTPAGGKNQHILDIACTIQNEISEDSKDLKTDMVTQVIEKATKMNMEDIVGLVEVNTGLSNEKVQNTIQTITQSEDAGEVVEALENMSKDEVLDAITQAAVTEEIIKVIEENTGLTTEDISEVIQEKVGVTVTEKEIIETVKATAASDTLPGLIHNVDSMTNNDIIQAVLRIADEVAECKEVEAPPVEETVKETVEETVEETAATTSTTAAPEDCLTAQGIEETIINSIENVASKEITEMMEDIAREEVAKALAETTEPAKTESTESNEEECLTPEAIRDAVESSVESGQSKVITQAVESLAQEKLARALEEMLPGHQISITTVLEPEHQEEECLTPEAVKGVIREPIESKNDDDDIEPEIIIALGGTTSSQHTSEPTVEPAKNEEEEECLTPEGIKDAVKEDLSKVLSKGADIKQVVQAIERASGLSVNDIAELAENKISESVTPEDIMLAIREAADGAETGKVIELVERLPPFEVIEALVQSVGTKKAEAARNKQRAFLAQISSKEYKIKKNENPLKGDLKSYLRGQGELNKFIM